MEGLELFGHKTASAKKFRFSIDKRFGMGMMWRGYYLSIAWPKMAIRIGKANLTGNKTIKITDQPCRCTGCHWIGTVWDCESDEETGDLLCPKCLVAIEV